MRPRIARVVATLLLAPAAAGAEQRMLTAADLAKIRPCDCSDVSTAEDLAGQAKTNLEAWQEIVKQSYSTNAPMSLQDAKDRFIQIAFGGAPRENTGSVTDTGEPVVDSGFVDTYCREIVASVVQHEKDHATYFKVKAGAAQVLLGRGKDMARILAASEAEAYANQRKALCGLADRLGRECPLGWQGTVEVKHRLHIDQKTSGFGGTYAAVGEETRELRGVVDYQARAEVDTEAGTGVAHVTATEKGLDSRRGVSVAPLCPKGVNVVEVQERRTEGNAEGDVGAAAGLTFEKGAYEGTLQISDLEGGAMNGTMTKRFSGGCGNLPSNREETLTVPWTASGKDFRFRGTVDPARPGVMSGTKTEDGNMVTVTVKWELRPKPRRACE